MSVHSHFSSQPHINENCEIANTPKMATALILSLSENSKKMNRKNFIKKMLALGTAGVIYTWQVEPFWVEFVELDMGIRYLPKDLVGKTLMQISDLHIGNRFDRKYIIKWFEEAKKFKPDFVVYTGDFITYDSKEQFAQLSEVLEYAVLGSLGTIGILGNHDYGKNWSETDVANEVVRILTSNGISVLRNEAKYIAGLNFIGLDDYWGTNYNPNIILQSKDDSKANIVLCHNPDVADEPIWGDYSGWILSGHTHGGQCKPPFLNPPMLPVKNKRYTSGEIEVGDGRKLYINRALGHLWQVRFNVRPEITIFKLENKIPTTGL